MPNEDDLRRAVRYRRLVKSAGVGAVLTVLLLVHVFVLPLDVLWFAALKRFGVE
jgi:polysaccharide biosynthesis transport protein